MNIVNYSYKYPFSNTSKIELIYDTGTQPIGLLYSSANRIIRLFEHDLAKLISYIDSKLRIWTADVVKYDSTDKPYVKCFIGVAVVFNKTDFFIQRDELVVLIKQLEKIKEELNNYSTSKLNEIKEPMVSAMNITFVNNPRIDLVFDKDIPTSLVYNSSNLIIKLDGTVDSLIDYINNEVEKWIESIKYNTAINLRTIKFNSVIITGLTLPQVKELIKNLEAIKVKLLNYEKSVESKCTDKVVEELNQKRNIDLVSSSNYSKEYTKTLGVDISLIDKLKVRVSVKEIDFNAVIEGNDTNQFILNIHQFKNDLFSGYKLVKLTYAQQIHIQEQLDKILNYIRLSRYIEPK